MADEEKPPTVPPSTEIPKEASEMAGKIIAEAIKLIPNAPPSTNSPGPSLDVMVMVLKKLDIIEKNLYVVFKISEKILGELVDPAELKRIGVEVDRAVVKERMKK